jgi:uncharacterized membrane protein
MKNLYSLAAIIIVLGFSAPAFAHSTSSGDMVNGVPSYLDTALKKLPKQDADQFRATMKKAHEDNMAIADQVHSLHDELDTILSADTFDKEAFRTKSAQLRDVYAKMRTNSDDAFANAAAALPKDERQALVAALAYPHDKKKVTKSEQ